MCKKYKMRFYTLSLHFHSILFAVHFKEKRGLIVHLKIVGYTVGLNKKRSINTLNKSYMCPATVPSDITFNNNPIT